MIVDGTMTKTLTENLERLPLRSMFPGDKVEIVTAGATPTWLHEFNILDQYRKDLVLSCDLKTSDSNGVVLFDEKFLLDNPRVGESLHGSFGLYSQLSLEDWDLFFQQDREITSITRTPYRENSILRALARQTSPMTTRELVEAVVGDPVELDQWGLSYKVHIKESFIRTALAGLSKSGLITRTRKRSYEYSLTD